MPALTVFTNPPADAGPFMLVHWRDTTKTGGWYLVKDLASVKEYKSRVVAEKAAARANAAGGDVVVRPMSFIKEFYRDAYGAAVNPPQALERFGFRESDLRGYDRIARVRELLAARGYVARLTVSRPEVVKNGRRATEVLLVTNAPVQMVYDVSRTVGTIILGHVSESEYEPNPPRGTTGRGTKVSGRVYEIRYKHAADGKNYRHPFKAGVCAELLPDGSVRLYHAKGKPLMRDF